MDSLPPIAHWKSKGLIVDPSFPTKKPVYLSYRYAFAVLQDILESPLVQGYLAFTSLQSFETAENLITIANIDCDYHDVSMASHHLFVLLALLPHHLFQLSLHIPICRHKSQVIRGVPDNGYRTAPLENCTAIGIVVADPVGQVRRRRCRTPCAVWNVDNPEAAVLSCVGGGGEMSLFVTAIYTTPSVTPPAPVIPRQSRKLTRMISRGTAPSLRIVKSTALLICAGGTGLHRIPFLHPERHFWYSLVQKRAQEFESSPKNSLGLSRLLVDIKERFNATLLPTTSYTSLLAIRALRVFLSHPSLDQTKTGPFHSMQIPLIRLTVSSSFSASRSGRFLYMGSM
ncbi:hypothetical protein F5878DRAFT_664577 [Lentinula raphanica]|uniref:Uncharacterized protein n=1 Tax=Lentinula raphanica TaxID=153919 RepID=A0AA38UE20_9AGAR|nr:hypothetical protein F5878DRAFT_664577 [Lentinula raphanica]